MEWSPLASSTASWRLASSYTTADSCDRTADESTSSHEYGNYNCNYNRDCDRGGVRRSITTSKPNSANSTTTSTISLHVSDK